MNGRALRDQLYEVAARFAKSAMQAHAQKQADFFLLFAATSLEHLMKAVLASKHPSLVAGKDLDALLHALGLHQHARRPAPFVRSVPMRVASERCEQVVPALTPLRAGLGLLCDIRSGDVHLGQFPPAAMERVLPAYLEATAMLQEELNEDPREYWGTAVEEVQSRLAEARNAARGRVAEAIDAGKEAFRHKFRRSEAEWREERLRLIVESYDLSEIEQQLGVCPACGTLALLRGSIAVDYGPDFDYSDSEAWLAGATPASVEFQPERLECRGCGLRLAGTAELAAADIETRQELKEYDTEQLRRWEQKLAFFEAFEPEGGEAP